jgi:hypothetical protein
MTASDARHTMADWGIGLLAFVLVGVVALPILLTILKMTAPYGWNWAIVSACALLLLARTAFDLKKRWARRHDR